MDYKIGHSSDADAARAVEEACAGLRAPKFIWFASGVEAFEAYTQEIYARFPQSTVMGTTTVAAFCKEGALTDTLLVLGIVLMITYFVTGASYNTLYIPYGYTTIFYSLATDSTINQILIVDNLTNKTNKMFNGYRISLAKSPGYGYLSAVSSVPVGKLSSNYYLQYKAGAQGASSTNQLLEAFEDFIYYNGTWYSKGY